MRLLRKHRNLIGYLVLVAALVIAFSQIQSVTNQLRYDVKKNIESQVTTTAQRCTLTKLDATILARRDPADAKPYQDSLNGCMKQLAKVKKQAAQTP